jgi:hypothetical protein
VASAGLGVGDAPELVGLGVGTGLRRVDAQQPDVLDGAVGERDRHGVAVDHRFDRDLELRTSAIGPLRRRRSCGRVARYRGGTPRERERDHHEEGQAEPPVHGARKEGRLLRPVAPPGGGVQRGIATEGLGSALQPVFLVE